MPDDVDVERRCKDGVAKKPDSVFCCLLSVKFRLLAFVVGKIWRNQQIINKINVSVICNKLFN